MKFLKNKFTLLIFLSHITFSVLALAQEATKNSESKPEPKAEVEEASPRFGPGKAVEAFSKDDGFKLSEKAMNSLEIKFSPLNGAGPWRVSKESLVRLKQSDSVYRRFEGWISMVLVKVIAKENGSVLITSADLETGDEIASHGTQFLRMTDADLNSGTVDTCGH